MGALFNGGGGPLESGFTPGDHIKYEYGALLNQLEPGSSDPGGALNWDEYDEYVEMNMRDVLYDAMSFGGGNPFDGVAAVNPSTYLEPLSELRDDITAANDAFDPRNYVDESVDLAIGIVDDEILTASDINGLVAAFDARTKQRHLQAVSRVTDSLNMAMAGMTSTVSDTIASMEFDRQAEINDYDLKLVYADRQARTDMIQTMVQNYFASLMGKFDAIKSSFAVASDAAKINISALQDQIEKDLEFATSEQLWDVQTIQHGLNALQVGAGMPLSPRGPTRAERTMQQITSAISFGAQAGAAFGPGAGLLAGGGTLALDFLMNRATA
jgi:hypothetical protein